MGKIIHKQKTVGQQNSWGNHPQTKNRGEIKSAGKASTNKKSWGNKIRGKNHPQTKNRGATKFVGKSGDC